MDLPTIDMIRTGKNINRLRKQANLSVKDLQNIFGFATPQVRSPVHFGRCRANVHWTFCTLSHPLFVCVSEWFKVPLRSTPVVAKRMSPGHPATC